MILTILRVLESHPSCNWLIYYAAWTFLIVSYLALGFGLLGLAFQSQIVRSASSRVYRTQICRQTQQDSSHGSFVTCDSFYSCFVDPIWLKVFLVLVSISVTIQIVSLKATAY